MCGLGRILGYIGGRPSVGATMSQSGSGGSKGSQNQSHQQRSGQQQSDAPSTQPSCQNGRADAATKSTDTSKSDISNGFENRTTDYDRFGGADRSKGVIGTFQQPQATRPPAQYPSSATDLPPEYSNAVQQMIQYPTLRRPSTAGQQEDRHTITAQLLPQQYPPDKSSLERVQYVSQTGTQTVAVQAQPHFGGDYMTDQAAQYAQIRPGQFEVRSQVYSQQQPQQQAREYGDRAGYVTRDITYREQAGTALYAGTGPYVTVQHAGSQLPSQSASPQPPYYAGVVVPTQAPPGYGQFAAGQPQYPYSQYPQTVMNPIPYNTHGTIYQPQQFSQQSPNPQRFSQDMSQFQTQPIIQPIAQNVMTASERSSGRGPKPMVPPRGNSKITHGDPGHRKSVSIDVPAQKPVAVPPKYESGQNAQGSQEHGIRNEATLLIAAGHVGPDGQERRFLSPINQNPRTRQDGLYVDSNGDQVTRDKAVDTVALDCGLYVSKSEHRKSVSVDVTTSFQKRNDTITFTFPGDNNHQDASGVGRKTASLGDRKRPETTQVFPVEVRRVEPILRVSPMAFDQRQENRKSIVPERQPEWGNVSPNQRGGGMSSQENRRSDYFEEHRRSPMTLDAKRMEDIRRSPMPFVPMREPSNDRAAQKSPSFLNQNFEKTRQELAMWAEQRQRQELERGLHPSQIFSTSPRSRNQSEERREPRAIIPMEESSKDPRMSQNAFQPIPVISQSSIMEQRRHLRHVSADLTKHMELSRKDFEDQPITGSVANLVPIINSSVSSQRASPNLCHQHPALSEAKLDSKTLQLTVVTDFGDNHIKSNVEQSDHIIHSHRKSHNVSTSLLPHSKSQADNLQSQSEGHNDKTDTLQAQQQQQQQQHLQLQNQQMQNQQSLDMISEKLSQFERQQSDLQAKLQCLQNQNHILDKVAQYQHHQSDLQVRFQCLQERQVGEKTLRQATEYQPMGLVNELHQIQLSPLPDHLLEQTSDKVVMITDQSPQPQQVCHRQSLHPVPTYVSSQTLQNQPCQSSVCERLSPRLTLTDCNDPSSLGSQITLPGNSQFERTEGGRGSLQYRLSCASDVSDSVVAVAPHASGAGTTSGSTAGPGSFTGTLKKVPPEKPPRTSLIIQSPEPEVNESMS